ncbi:MAG TPA: sulfotransferase family 2 domain-containing protein [Nocardioides sp.]|uniref:sulfotransferase family 2 domain-containing protein n=1 Tax=Nocardioides sp. TaxID=35761 RepID=UPI002D7F0145|nr:sulfotransferase family 2 domain-containing protein [Nocardioides sp.]HET6654105.1 sulfotransferase family 2 domain-containing protein [Nocardioides sp.]
MPVEPSTTRFTKTPGNSFVLPEHKLVYVSTTKVACTSLKWMVADLAGEDLEVFRNGSSGVQSRLMTIHRGRGRFRHTTGLNKMTPEQVAEINPENGWFVFGLLRDPWSRLWSAWQSKFLVRHHRYRTNFEDAPFFPRVPQRASDVVEDFARFVELHPWTSDPILRNDNHFHTQMRWLAPDRIPYTKVYDLRDFSTFTADLHAHLRGVGKDQELYLPRANETPLPMTREVMGGGVKEAIEELYKEDFDAYGHRWDFGSLKFAADGWNRDAIAHAAYHTVANDWIDHVNKTGKQWRHERDELARRQRAARKRLRRAEAEARRLRAENRRVQSRGRGRSLAGRVARAARSPKASLGRLTGRLRGRLLRRA